MDLHAENGTVIPDTLWTARLLLRPLTPANDAAIVGALADWNVVKWLTAVPWPYDLNDAAYFRTVIAADPNHPHWGIDNGTGLIGVISVKPDLGYWLTALHHSKGIMTEAAKAVINAAFKAGLQQITSGHIPGNAPSSAILQKLGFHDTKIVSRHHRPSSKNIVVQRMILTHATHDRLRNAAQ